MDEPGARIILDYSGIFRIDFSKISRGNVVIEKAAKIPQKTGENIQVSQVNYCLTIGNGRRRSAWSGWREVRAINQQPE